MNIILFKDSSLIIGFEYLYLSIKGLSAYIKYIINLLEIADLKRFESKLMIFSVIEFIFIVIRLIFQIILINELISAHLHTYYALFDLWNILKILEITFNNFIK